MASWCVGGCRIRLLPNVEVLFSQRKGDVVPPSLPSRPSLRLRCAPLFPPLCERGRLPSHPPCNPPLFGRVEVEADASLFPVGEQMQTRTRPSPHRGCCVVPSLPCLNEKGETPPAKKKFPRTGKKMYSLFSLTLLVTALEGGRRGVRLLFSPSLLPPRSRLRTMLDAPSPDEVERLVSLLARGEDVGGDSLADKVHSLYSAFPPDEGVMRRLSLFQQSCQGTGGRREYSLSLVYCVAMQVLTSLPPPPSLPPKRSSSFPLHSSSITPDRIQRDLSSSSSRPSPERRVVSPKLCSCQRRRRRKRSSLSA